MVTQEGSNVAVFAVQGDFDDAQSVVKKVFMDRTFNEKLLKEKNIFITSANSINWGRLLPQIVYYFTSYIQLVGSGALSWGGQMDIAIPTGNFGNILAAYYAKKMGLPVRKLICASNANNVLTDFLQTGIYDVSYRKLLQTPSPSMDILVASNIERLLFLITNDTERVALWMKDLATKKRFAVDAKTKQILQVDFFADWVSNEACLENIAHVYQQTGYVIDPHTSVAQLVATRYGEKSVQSLPLLIAATAHWSKFAKDVSRSLLGEDRSKSANEYKLLVSVCKFAKNASVPKVIMDLRQKEIRHTGTCAPTKEAVEVIIGNLAEEI
jgi:threonine synthase